MLQPGKICALFQPQFQAHAAMPANLNTKEPDDCTQPADMVEGAETVTSLSENLKEKSGLEDDTESTRKLDSAFVSLPLALLTPRTEPRAATAIRYGMKYSL